MKKPDTKRSALGKGLSALFTEETTGVFNIHPEPALELPRATPLKEPLRVSIERLTPNPKQPRRLFADDSLSELAHSIKTHGILQPILVCPEQNGRYEIIAGERRWRAAQRADLKDVPILIHEGSEAEHFQVALIENIQRSDLNAMELAKGYQRLSDEFGMTQEAIALSVGKDRAVVANTLRLLNLASEIQTAVEAQSLSAAHARTIAGLESHTDQMSLFKRVVAEQLTVREVEWAVRSKKGNTAIKPAHTVKTVRETSKIQAVEAELQTLLTRKVELHETDRTSHKGWLKLEYYSLEDLDELLKRIKKS